MAIVLNGTSLTVEELVRIARHGEKVELAPEALERIRACRAMLEEKIDAREIMYGVNTGIGEFSEVVLTDEQVKQFQRYLDLQPRRRDRRPRARGVRPRAPWPGASTSTPTATPAAGPRSRRRSSRCSTGASRRSSARRARSAPAATSRRCRRSRCC